MLNGKTNEKVSKYYFVSVGGILLLSLSIPLPGITERGDLVLFLSAQGLLSIARFTTYVRHSEKIPGTHVGGGFSGMIY